ncbi:hypothetical protein ATO49_09920 [Mycolicibacterium fortuitum subsp. fortuitum DSM 46621 = ATCC 6841 = JCM 6387]|nr:hypothetical protein ATO49_09920 [Mycolicibacterium fortuitum subsp. fortuitum DSM 46621 = ATCC 6841 = JCM 6387]
MLAQELATRPLAQPASPGVAVVGVEHNPAAVRVQLEHTGDDARQQDRTHAAIYESQIGDRGVHADVVRIGGIAGRDGILGGAVQLDVTGGLSTEARDQRPRVLPVQLRLQVTPPPLGRPVVLPGFDQMRTVHPLGDQLGVSISVGRPDVVRLGQNRDGRRIDGAHLVGDVGQLAFEDGAV